MERRIKSSKRRVQTTGVNGWRCFGSHNKADAAGKAYMARCRAEFKPEGFYVLSKREGSHLNHYPVLIVPDATGRQLHARRSGFGTTEALARGEASH